MDNYTTKRTNSASNLKDNVRIFNIIKLMEYLNDSRMKYLKAFSLTETILKH